MRINHQEVEEPTHVHLDAIERMGRAIEPFLSEEGVADEAKLIITDFSGNVVYINLLPEDLYTEEAATKVFEAVDEFVHKIYAIVGEHS